MSTETVPKGYKRTEVGVIPEEWEVVSVGQMIQLGLIEKPLDGNHGNIHPKSGDYVQYGIPFVMANNLKNGKLDLSSCAHIRKKQADSLLKGFAKTGDVLLTHKATIGNTAIVGDVPFEYVMLTPQVTYYRVSDKNRLSNVYLRQYFDSIVFQSTIKALSGGGTRSYIGISAQHILPVICPPTLAEQQAIAAALSDADALIESLESLLAKKRQIKQGAMQELLTGKRRLPGFTGKWETRSIGDLFAVYGGVSASRDQLSSSGHCYLHYGDIHVSPKNYISVSREEAKIPKLNIPLGKISPRSLLKTGDVVFVDASEDDAGTSKHFVVFNEDDKPFISGLHTIVAKPKDESLDHTFKRYVFQTAAVKSQFKFYAVGTKVSGVSKSNIVKIELTYPTLPEQTAIAAILSDMDAELEAIEAKLEKARQVKQGMMQQLLTGKVRLI